MDYSNPEIPEGINASQEHPLKEFFWLTTGVLTAGAVLVLIAALVADTFSHHIPFRIERQMSARYAPEPAGPPALNAYLSQLAARIADAEKLPDGMDIRVHYHEGDVVNAFATLGGHIVVFRGLLEKLPNENALAMVLAHEIAHIKHRDPIRAVGRAAVIGLSLSIVSSSAGDVVLDRAFSSGTMLTILKFSRDQERAADDAGIKALTTLYGHTNGAASLFAALDAEASDASTIDFFRSHPGTDERIANAERHTDATGRITPLPDAFRAWLGETPSATGITKDEEKKQRQ